MIRQPNISVCMPTYNQGRYIRQALDSVLRQTKQDFEIIVYDDASTDDTQQIVAAFTDERLRYFRQPRNVGIAANRNSCLAAARGHYIAWLDSDDIYRPEMLAIQSGVLDRHPNVGLTYGAFEVIDNDGRRLPDWPLPFTSDVIESGKEALRELTLHNYITAPTVMVRRACYDIVGPYSTELANSGEDWEMWLRIALHADLAYTATAVAQYRQHEDSISSSTIKNGERLCYDIKVIRRIFRDYGHLLPDAPALKHRAVAALAAKTLIRSGEAFTRGQRWAAIKASLPSVQIANLLLRRRDGWLFLLTILSRKEFANYRHSKALLNELHAQIAGTRYGEKIEKIAVTNAEWEQKLREIAQVVRQLVPKDARLASVDKSDPTLLHLCRRNGWHFPDWSLLPGGYPRDSNVAIEHLEELKARGADYLLFPSAAFWWLEFYEDFARHLDDNYACLWRDENCVLYELRHPEVVKVDSRSITRVPQTSAAVKYFK